ncbi:MAG: SDR family oxidoreductase [Alphaproteobacteria bacterium]|nr:SDR family oxidoreductase [Alphaproteobacteria bacterium]
MMQHVFITAGGSGLGLAMAKAFMANGAAVAVTDTDTTALDKVRADHPGLVPYEADASNEDAMRDVYADLRKRWERLDVVMANAGIAGPTAAVEDVRLEDWRRCLAVNLDGAFLAASLAAPWMKNQKDGVITLTSSTAGLFGYPYRSPYATAKWGIIGLTKTLAMELGPYNIRVNAICPGSVEGDRMDRVIANEAKARGIPAEDLRRGYADCASLRRFVTAEDVANMATFLASPAAQNVSGMAMTVDGHTEKVTL